jgi:hypothetical protein
MSKFNQVEQKPQVKVLNKENHPAYAITDSRLTLLTQVFTTLVGEDKFYGDNTKEILVSLRDVIKHDPLFVASLGLYARKDLYLRSIFHVIVAEMAKAPEGKKYVKQLVINGAIRVDDLTEILAYYLGVYGKPIPNALKKGLGQSLKKFDEYQLAKYNRDGKVTLKDILRLAHPTPGTSQDLFNKIMNDTLETPYTWETQLSQRGNSRLVWEELIDSQKVPYMATLRNLRNIVQAGVSNEHIQKVADFISNERFVSMNKQLPFRYLNAYDALQESNLMTSKLQNAIGDAFKASVANLPRLKGKTAFLVDVSGSMTSPVATTRNGKTRTTPSDIASTLATLGGSIAEDSIVIEFDTQAKKSQILSGNRLADVLTARKRFNGGGTDISSGFTYLLQNKISVDRIVLISDSEANCGYSAQRVIQNYKSQVNPNVKIFMIDVMGYGTVQAKGDNIYVLAGWSEKIFNFIDNIEQDRISAVNQILEKYSYCF